MWLLRSCAAYGILLTRCRNMILFFSNSMIVTAWQLPPPPPMNLVRKESQCRVNTKNVAFYDRLAMRKRGVDCSYLVNWLDIIMEQTRVLFNTKAATYIWQIGRTGTARRPRASHSRGCCQGWRGAALLRATASSRRRSCDGQGVDGRRCSLRPRRTAGRPVVMETSEERTPVMARASGCMESRI